MIPSLTKFKSEIILPQWHYSAMMMYTIITELTTDGTATDDTTVPQTPPVNTPPTADSTPTGAPSNNTGAPSSNIGAIVGGIVVLIIVLIIAVSIVIIVIIIYYRKPQGKEAFSEFQNSVRRGLGTHASEKPRDVEMEESKAPDVEKTDDRQQKPPRRKAPTASESNNGSSGGMENHDRYIPSTGGAIYEDPDRMNETKKRARIPTGASIGYEDMDIITKPVSDGTYEAIDRDTSRDKSVPRSQSSANQEEDQYNQLGGVGRRPAPGRPKQDTQVQLEQSTRASGSRLPSTSAAKNPMYSSVQVQDVYAEIDKSKPPAEPIQEYAAVSKPKRPPPPQPIQ